MRSTPLLAIETHGLVKSFGAQRAVDGIDLAVRSGAIHGVLGPNGAGKTTTVRMLATLLRPDAGTATILGHDLGRDADAIRQRISLTGQFASVDEDLTGSENLILIARLLGFSRRQARSRAEDLLHAFDLTDAARRQVKAFSGGMRRRLDIAASIIVTPDLLFLDEPTTGLDPRSRNEVWDIVRALAGGGTTVLLTTQYLEEADTLADRIAVIDRGRVIAEGTSADLKASVGTDILHVRLRDASDRDKASAVLASALAGSLGGPVHLDGDPRRLTAQLTSPDQAASGLAALAQQEIPVSDFSLGQPSLDEVFFALTGHHVPDEEGGGAGAAPIPAPAMEGEGDVR